MHFARSIGLAVAAGAMLAQLNFSHAADTKSFIVCNKTTSIVSVAIGYRDGSNGWTSEGWWKALPGACTPNLFRGNNKVFYYYAHNSDRVILSDKVSAEGSFFCTSPKSFTDRWDSHRTARNSYDCEKAGLDKRKFSEILVSGPKIIDLVSDQPAPLEIDAPAAPSSRIPATGGPHSPTSSACQRYPNLC